MKHFKSWVLLAALFSVSQAFGAVSELDKSQFAVAQNALPNGSAEAGKAGPVASGGTFTTSTSVKYDGKSSFAWDSSAAGQTLTYSVAIPEWLKSKNAVVSCQFKCASGTCTHTLTPTDGTNALATAATISSSTSSWLPTTINFPAPSSGNVAFKVTSVAADEPNLYIDGCFIADAGKVNLGFITNVTAWQSYTPTGGWSTNATYTGNWRRVGDSMEVVARVDLSGAPSGTASISIPSGYTIDTSKIPATSSIQALGSANSLCAGNVYTFAAEYASTSTVQFHPNSNGTAVTATNPGTYAAGNYITTTFRVPIVGWNAEAAFRPDQTPASWAGNMTGASWSTTSTSYANPTVSGTPALTSRGTPRNMACTQNGTLPSITCVLPKVGTYQVCAYPPVSNNGANNLYGAQLSDGSSVIASVAQDQNGASSNNITLPLCGSYSAVSSGSVSFQIKLRASAGTTSMFSNGSFDGIGWTVNQSDAGSGALYLIGSVTSNSSGQEHLEHLFFGASTGSKASPANCTGTCLVYNQSGSWVTGAPTRTGTGVYTVPVAAGEYSDVPDCTCSPDYRTAGQSCEVTATSSTSLTVFVVSNNAAVDASPHVICMGPH